MVLLFKTEASPTIGHGHVMRCIALAEVARRKGAEVAFLSRDAYTDELLRSRGQTLATEALAFPCAKWIIRDFRDGSDEQEVADEASSGVRVLLLDELGPARAKASLVADSMMTDARCGEYVHGTQTRYLYGLKYAPLRQAFARPFGDGVGEGLLIALGGGDLAATTKSYVDALHAHGFRGPATIVCNGAPAMMRAMVARISDWRESALLSSSDRMEQLMRSCSVVVTKLGMTLLESFSRGRPAVLIEPSDAHLTLNLQLSEQYPGWPAVELGLAKGMDYNKAAAKTLLLLQDEVRLLDMGMRAAELIDGHGSERLIEALLDDKTIPG